MGGNIGCFGSSAYYRYNFRYIPDIFSRSANLIEVPDLIGKNFAEAKEYYKDKDITLTLLQTVDSSEYDKDEIIDQNPKAGKW